MGWPGLGNVCGRLVRTLRTQNGIRRRKQSDNWRSANKVKDQPRASWERDKRVECARLVTLGIQQRSNQGDICGPLSSILGKDHIRWLWRQVRGRCTSGGFRGLLHQMP